MKTEFYDSKARIRRCRLDDVPALFEAVDESRWELSIWMAWCHPNYSLEDTATFVRSRDAVWEQGDEYSFVIVDLEDGRLLGGVGLNFVNRLHNFANLGYWVRRSCAGHGYATAAARLITRFGFEEAGFQRLEIVVDVENQASCRVAEKAGARREAVLRNRLQRGGKPRDAVMFSLIPDDLKASPIGDS